MAGEREILSVAISTLQSSYVLDSADIQEIYWIEDIFSFCITGKMIFQDRTGLFEFGPITGTERIDVIYGTNTKGHYDPSYLDGNMWPDKELTFWVYKISKVSPMTGIRSADNQMFEMIFVDSKYHFFHSHHISTSFRNKSHSEIIKNLCDEYVGIRHQDYVDDKYYGKMFENSKSNQKLPYYDTSHWTVSQNVKWLMNRACSRDSKSGEPGYLFYRSSRNTEKPWNLVTLERLLRQEHLMPPYDSSKKGLYVFEDSTISSPNKIISYEFNHIDYISLKNLIGNIYYGFDSTRKKFIKRRYVLDDETKFDPLHHFTVLGDYTLFAKDIHYDNSPVQVECEGFDNKEEILDNMFLNDWIKRYCLQQIVTVYVNGHQGRHCGGMIEIAWPSRDTQEHKFNKRLMGKYLVKSVVHYFNQFQSPLYKQKLTLIKNGYEDADVDLMKSQKTNLAKISLPVV